MNTPSAFQIGPAARHLASPVASEAALVIIEPEDEADFLSSSWSRQHSLLTVLSLISKRGLSAGAAADVRHSFAAMDPKRFLEKFSGRSLPGVLGLFEKLGARRPRNRQSYLDIVAIFTLDGEGAKTLRHFPYPRFEYIEALAALPDWMRTDNFIFENTASARQTGLIAEVLLASGSVSSHRDVLGILSSREFGNDPFRALARYGISFRFPEAPWSGPHLEPVRDTIQLSELGQRYRNCAKSYSDSLLRGSRYFFIWREAREILVDVHNPSGLRWIVHEVEAADQMGVDTYEQAAITAELGLEDYNLRLWRQSVSGPGELV